MKKQIFGVLVCAMLSNWVMAKTPQTALPVGRPTTATAVQRPQTSVAVMRPVTQTNAMHPTTNVQAAQPQTTVQVVRPQTTVAAVHPQTTVLVFHPQTSSAMQADANQAPAKKVGGKSVSSSQALTSMSDFSPKPAKNFTADKAATLGGGSMNLGNSTDQAAKDAAAKASLLGAQNNQNIDVDLKQNKLSGVDKLVTDRAKWKEKQK